ncbi:MAG TPA: restriction endonuclease subunit S [Methylocella sp.]|nr:restriction endonuclease subunit S [Methylocella sp.]
MAGESQALEVDRGWLFHPVFSQDWQRSPLYPLAQWVNGIAFRDIQFSASGRPVIKIAEIKGGISEQTKFTEQTFDESVLVRSGDLLFSWSGQPETSIDAFWWRGPEGWLNQHVFKVTPREGIDATFFFYLLRYLKPKFVGIARNKQTTGLGHVTKRDLETIVVAVPDSAEQRAIAHILGTLDDKIELNRRMNETLEAMARTLFKSWFVDFDPVRAKSQGRDPGLPKPLADLFPGRLVGSELGEIPEGWGVATLGDVAENPRRAVQPYEIEPDVPYIALEHMPKRCIALSDWGIADGLESNKFEFETSEVLFGKLRPYFHKVGVAPVDGVCSTDIVVVSPKSEHWFGFVLGHVSSDAFVEYTNAASTGTKMPRTSWGDMARYPVVWPPPLVAGAFTKQIRPYINRIISGIHESRTLAALRDTLLPKLISGQVRIENAERFMKERAL